MTWYPMARVAKRIRAVHDADGTYGAPRITAKLNEGAPEPERVHHKRVARVMRGVGIAGYRRKRRIKTNVSDPAKQKVPNLLGRDFTAAAGASQLARPEPDMMNQCTLQYLFSGPCAPARARFPRCCGISATRAGERGTSSP